MTTPIELDGAMGEGGEQILRSALGLSLLSGRPFQLSCIRADRDRAGLRPQHLAAVHAAAAISAARVTADRIGSEAITFEPGPVRAGDYFFDIGAAGGGELPASPCAAGPTSLQAPAITI
jgi:RNA 3'-terminal phosphate cyclase (ATP)